MSVLWAGRQAPADRKLLEEEEEERLAPYALKSRVAGEHREHREKSPLQYRTQFHRDRDRIIWCRTFKRLQHKTQIFPHYVTDHFRRRLTHTLEVSQIATTIARALYLNEVATEAMALAHDLGHAPFGHAGEIALDAAVRDAQGQRPDNPNIPIWSFNHAVQGVELLERIEQEYATPGMKPMYGLNLTREVREGVLKHRRWKAWTNAPPCPAGGTPKPSLWRLADLAGYSKYTHFGTHPGSLEAQCVLLADKVAYFFADLEDGLRSGILPYRALTDALTTLKDLFQRTFEEEQRMHNVTYQPPHAGVDDIDAFLDFRRKGIAAFILAAVRHAWEDLQRDRVTSPDEGSRRIYVALPPDIEEEKESVYGKLVQGIVLTNYRYQTMEEKAKRIVSDLFKAYLKKQSLIPKDFRDRTCTAYRDLVSSEELIELLAAKNYVAGMTDSFAISNHADLFMSSKQVPLA
ncbi:MAG: dGTP triphosphohydrolase [Candidatus Methylomirabilota bacterium]|jgi:dGTPase